MGAGQTLAISLLAILFATLGGVAYGVLAQQGGRLVRGLLRVYLELFRVVPVLVWLYLFFFGLPIFFGLDIPAFWCAVLVLALWGASEVGEVVRGGLNSLARGQQEAGLALHDDLAVWERAAEADAQRIAEARDRHEPTEATTATIDRWQRFRALLNSVYPCPRCRPSQFARWRNGCYQPGHVARRCKVCAAALEEVRR